MVGYFAYFDIHFNCNISPAIESKMSAVMERHLFNLKFAVKEMKRNAKKCNKEETQERMKCKNSLKKGNLECAKIHAENAIRQKNQALMFLNMSARLDGVANKVQHAMTMRQVSRSMAGVTKAMDSALTAMNLEKISYLMDQFEKQCLDLDVQTGVVHTSMAQSVTTAIPQKDVDSLMIQIAEEAGLEVRIQLPQEVHDSVGTSLDPTVEKDDLEKRLTKLRKTD